MLGDDFSPFDMMKRMADGWLKNQVRNPEDYVGPDGLLVCGKCGEPKQKIIDFPDPTSEDPGRTGKLKTVAECRCEREEREKREREEQAEKDMKKVRELKTASLMDDKFREATFSTFQATKHNERNFKLCTRYAEKFELMPNKNQGLLFWGDVGTGKSFAAACIANYLLERKIPVVMTSFVKLLELIQSNGDEGTKILNKLEYVRLVIFDDLGAERSTDYALEKVYNIIDTRYRKKLPMILTTNLTIEEMKDEIDMRYKRIYDRVFETCHPIQFTGPSWRKREASRRFYEMQKFLEGED